MVDRFGLERVGFLTLTFPRELSLSEANRRFHSFASNCFGAWFEAWLNVREFCKRSQRPHMHLVVAARGDIRTGFDFGSYLQMVRISRSRGRKARRGEVRELGRRLNPNPLLRSLWAELREACPRYQFGRHELIPIRKEGKAIALYVGGYIRKSLQLRPDSAKGARLVTYSEDFPRRVIGHAWQWNTPGSAAWRRKLELFASIHGVRDFADLSRAFGPRWAWWFRDVIESLNVEPWEDVVRRRWFDGERFMQAQAVAPLQLCPERLHVYPPRPPLDDNGKPFPVPRRLSGVFDYHSRMWSQPYQPF